MKDRVKNTVQKAVGHWAQDAVFSASDNAGRPAMSVVWLVPEVLAAAVTRWLTKFQGDVRAVGLLRQRFLGEADDTVQAWSAEKGIDAEREVERYLDIASIHVVKLYAAHDSEPPEDLVAFIEYQITTIAPETVTARQA